MKKTGIIVCAAAALVLAACFASYNMLVRLDEGVKNAWAQVDTVLQRRYDLIPNLVNAVKGYVKHEQGVLDEITRLRSQWAAARDAGQRVEAANQLETVLGRLLLVTENYPDLKANRSFIALQDELAGTENRISVERRRYNDAVTAYNVAVRRFPSSIPAALFGFQRSDAYFKAAQGAADAPRVQF